MVTNYLGRSVKDVADSERDDPRVGTGAVHGESLATAGLAVGEGGSIESIDGGADEGAYKQAVDPRVGRSFVEHVVLTKGGESARGLEIEG